MNKEELKLIPSSYGTGKLFPFLPDDGTLDFTVTRNCTATRINKLGLMETVSTNTPRIDWSTGDAVVLREDEATNLEFYSTFSTEGYAKYSGGTETDIIENADTAPDGTQTATKLIGGDGLGRTYNKSRVIPLIKNTDYVYSYYIKDISLVSMRSIIYLDDSDGVQANKSISFHAYPTQISKTKWTRLEFTFNTGDYDGIYLIQPTRDLNTGEDILVWGYQLEKGDKATSLIHTNGSAVTRLKDEFESLNYTSNLGRTTRYVVTPTEKKLIINEGNYINDTQVKRLISYKGLFDQQTIDSLNINKIQYGVADDIRTELTEIQTENADFAIIAGKVDTGLVEAIIPEDGSFDVTCERNCTATYVDKNGIIQTAGIDIPRIDWSTGEPTLLREGQATNTTRNSTLVKYSEASNDTVITPNATIAPDGTKTAYKIDPTNNTLSLDVFFSNASSGDRDALHVMSCYVKPVEGYEDNLLEFEDGWDGRYIRIQLDTGEISSSSNVFDPIATPIGNGWFRISIKKYFSDQNQNNISPYFSSKDKKPYYIWGCQVELNELTSYIPTTTSNVTRLADKLSVPTNRMTTYLNDRVIINPTEIDENTSLVKGFFGLQPQTTINAVTPNKIKYGLQEDIKKTLQLARKFAEPSLMMLPNIGEPNKLESIIPDDGSGDFTVARNSVGSYIDKDGLLKWSNPNEPRFDWSSGRPTLLVEPQRTNLFSTSQNFSAWTTNYGSFTPAEIGYIFNDGADNNRHQTYSNGISVTTGATYTLSLEAKAKDHDWIQLCPVDGEMDPEMWANFNLSKGTIGQKGLNTVARIKPIGDGWYRISVTGDAIATGASYIRAFVSTNNTDSVRYFSYQGTNADCFFVNNAQFEEGSAPSTPIKTEGGAVTRLQENYHIHESSLGFVNNNLTGFSFVFEGVVRDNGLLRQQLIELVDDTYGTGERFRMYFQYANTQPVAKIEVYTQAGSWQGNLGVTSPEHNTPFKMVAVYDNGTATLYLNGVKESVSTHPPFTSQFTKVSLGHENSLYQSGECIRGMWGYGQVLTEDEAIELSTPYYNSFNDMADDYNYIIK